jgi:hypothetical protein
MSEIVIFSASGLGFLGLMIFWASRTARSTVNAKQFSEVQQALTEVQLELPPKLVGTKIFSEEDWNFIRAHTAPAIQRIFLEDRKALAISWLRQVRGNVGLLMKFHRTAVRGNVSLSPSIELRLAFDYLFFLLTFQVLCAMIRVQGPFVVGRFANFTLSAADQLSYLSGHILVGMDASRLGRIKNNWSNKAAAA